jgi:large repetitive protein
LVENALVMTNSAGPFDLGELLDENIAYYIEVISGDNEGQRFDVVVTSVEEDRIALAIDTDLYAAAPPFNTLTSVPTSLAGDLIVLRRHWTLEQLFPPGGFTATNNSATADQVQIYSDGSLPSPWRHYWLYEGEDQASPRWVLSGHDLADQGGTLIQPGQGMFFNNRGSQISLLAFGEVRDNAFVRPLAAGMNLVGGGYPVDQSALGSSTRQLRLASGSPDIRGFDGFFGSLDFKTADSFFIWKADATGTAGPATYDTYWLLNRISNNTVSWAKVGEVTGFSHEDTLLFLRDRSVFQRAKNAIPAYGYPAPWSPAASPPPAP